MAQVVVVAVVTLPLLISVESITYRACVLSLRSVYYENFHISAGRRKKRKGISLIEK